jgi:hypothetical protein
MASFAGLISGVLGGAAAGYGEGAQMEMKKQADLDLRKQMLEAETEKASRLDEIKRGRDVKGRLDEEARVQSPAFLKAQAEARAGAFTADVAAGVPQAKAASDVATGTAAAGAETTLAPVKAAAASATTLANAEANAAVAPAVAKAFTEQYKASKEFENLKASDATDAQIKKAKTLAADTGYMDALAKIDLATHANIIRAAEIRAATVESTSEDRLEASRIRSLNSSKGPGSTVPTTADLQRQITAAENSLANKLGVKKTDLNEELARLQKRTDAASKAKFDGLTTEMATLDAARKRLLEWSKKPKDAAAPAAAAPSARPPLSTFGSK